MVLRVMKRLFTLSLVIGVSFLLLAPSLAQAMSGAQQQIFKAQIHYYNVAGCGSSNGNTSDTSGSPSTTSIGSVYMVGDSITVRAKDDLDSAFKSKNISPYINASVNRSITQPGTDAGFQTSGLNAVAGDTDRIKNAGAVVIALGTNQRDSDFNSAIKDMVNKVKGINTNAKIYWVNVFSEGKGTTKLDRTGINKSISDLSSSLGYTVIDTVNKGIEVDTDNVHETVGKGTQTFASLVADGVDSGGQPSGGGATSDSGGSCCSSSGAASPTSAPASSNTVVWPFATKNSSQYNRVDQGWDIQDKAGATVYAIAPGTLHKSNPDPGAFGNDYPTEELDKSIGGPTTFVYYGHVHIDASLDGKHVDSGQAIAKANVKNGDNGSAADPGWLEVGFANSNQGDPIAHGQAASSEGQKMKDLLINAQPGAGTVITSTAGGSASTPTITSCCSSSSSSAVSLTGKDNETKVFNYLVNTASFTPAQAAGIMGNMQDESGFEPERQESLLKKKVPAELFPEPGGGPGYGLVQWTPGGGMINTFTPKSQASDLGNQLKFLQDQLEGKGPLPDKAAGDLLKTTKTPEEAASSFENNYEHHAGPPQPHRQTNARHIYTQYASAASGGGGSSSDTVDCTTASDGSGAVTGQYSLPVDKKWYTQNKDWFTKPHHDYPAADIPVPTGTNVYAVAKGKVSSLANSGPGGGAGTHVFITDGDVTYGYFHGTAGSLKVQVGDDIKPGQLLMLSDNTGHTTGAHLHFQIEIKGVKHCPQNLLVAIGDGTTPPDLSSLPTSGCTN